MTPEHTSQLELVKALRELGAVQIRVGDVSASFDPLQLVPLNQPEWTTGQQEELDELRAWKRKVESLDLT